MKVRHLVITLTVGGMLAGTVAGVAAGTVAGTAAARGPGARSVAVPGRMIASPDPARFSNPLPNPYFPLKVGTVFRYRGTDGGRHYREKVVVTHRTKLVQDVRTRVLSDVLRRADGSLAEKTSDWYAADNAGTVWYFGEHTATYDRSGHLRSREGSWQAGVKGARAGVIMPAKPRPTDAYRQEFWRGQAEDQAWIVRVTGRTTVPYGHVRHVVRTYEWSRLEPNVVSAKLYGPGLGIVKEWDLAGGTERFELVGVSHR